jgi:hypothetical protein
VPLPCAVGVPQPVQVIPATKPDPSPDTSIVFGSVRISPPQVTTGVMHTVKSKAGSVGLAGPAGGWLGC